MITLDYRTNNPHWRISGIQYQTWESYAFALGYLANELHYRNCSDNGLVELHFERNDKQGAWDKEGRIHYYGTSTYFQSTFKDWNVVKSAGIGNITFRINSNDYVNSLVHDYGFEVYRKVGRTTLDIYPPKNNPDRIIDILLDDLLQQGFSRMEIMSIEEAFISGWNE